MPPGTSVWINEVKDRLKRWESSGNVSFSHQDHDGVTHTALTSFYPFGDAYRKTVSMRSDCNTQVNTWHFFSVGGKYLMTRNQQAYSYIYNRTTGVRTYRMENVNGNYSIELYLNYTFPLDKAKKLILIMNSGYDFYHNVDLLGEEDGAGEAFVSTMPGRSVVKTNLIGQAFTLRWKIKKHNLRFYASGNLHLANSSRENFDNITAGDFRYGMEARIELPLDIQLSTDMTMYSRRGYNSRDMNTDDFVWNARLSKRFWRNRLTFMIDGFDILHQLSGTTFSING